MPLRYPLQDSVGRGGTNFIVDVMSVKTMLNANMPAPLLGLNVNGICDWQTVEAIENYQRDRLRMAVPTGRIDPFDATHLSLNQNPALARPSTGKKYTSSPNEVAVEKTMPTLRQVVDILLMTWSDLSEAGARILTAQFMAENGAGKFCFNWNLGNEKSPTTAKLHAYRALVWECYAPSVAAAWAASGKGLAHIATAEEIAKYGRQFGWHCDNTMVLFSAPHMQCCFYAYASLKEGAERWLERYKTAARTYPDFFKILQAGDAAGVAKALGRAGYYTASEAAYANAMISQRRILDAQLGPIPSPPLRLGREASSADRRARQ